MGRACQACKIGIGCNCKGKLYLNMPKCEFGNTSLVYLGYIVRGGELKIDPFKVEVIVNWPKPNNVTDVRRILGEDQYGGSSL